jgi:RNA polymerase sigma-70 factor (ECF subfamily)
LDALEEIIKGCVLGKTNSQEQLYKMFAAKMYGVCLHYSKDSTEAEDILQEGFYKILKNIKSFKNEGSFEGWVRRIMINTALEKYRKQKFLYPVSDIIEIADIFSYDDVISEITARDLLKLIQELSPKYRMVFSLYAIDGYSHKEISDMMGITIGTSKSNLSRARIILQKKVKELFNPKVSQFKLAR